MKFPLALPRPSRAERTALPAALLASLLLALVLQLWPRAPEALPEPALPRGFRLAPLPAPAVVIDPQLATRPLFAPGRRADGAAATGAADPLGGFRAVGATSVRGRVRVFVQAPDGTVQALGIGGRVGGGGIDAWRLEALTPNGARFSRADESVVLAIGASPSRPARPEAAAPIEEEETP